MACRIAGVARTTYYERKFHVPSDREIRRLLLTDLIADIHERSRGTYGMLRIRAALKIEHDMIVNKKLILSIMRELRIQGLTGADLTGADLSSAYLYDANLSGATLTNADLAGADLTAATLSGVISGGITGAPTSLPSGWQLVSGYLTPS